MYNQFKVCSIKYMSDGGYRRENLDILSVHSWRKWKFGHSWEILDNRNCWAFLPMPLKMSWASFSC